jgi:nitroreductase
MTRVFLPDPVDAKVLATVLDAARRAPSAGNSQGTHLLVLDRPELTDRYWDASFPDPEVRRRFRWRSLLAVPVLVVVLAEPAAYVERYGEMDKARTGLGAGPEAWPVPYWTVDASFAAMLLQLAALDAGLGVLFFGLFGQAPAVLSAFGVPAGIVPVGTLALGHPAPNAGAAGNRGRSALRASRPTGEVVHLGSW